MTSPRNISLRLRLAPLAAGMLTLLCLSTAHAQNLKDDTSDIPSSAATSNISTSATGISQANPLARPADTVNTLTRDLGKIGSASQATNPNTRQLSRNRTASKPEPLTQFQRFVAEATGKNLPHFGASLFDTPDNYLPDEGLPVPASYILGPGDEVQLQVWGAVDFSATLVIDRNGQVLIPKVGSVSLAGVSMQDLEVRLRTQLAKVFTNFSLNANLARLRSIQIYVMGQARQPGTYVVSSLSTLVNALFASGGPNANGSMRHIQLQRNGKTVTEFDLYDLVARGDKTRDLALLPGDVIFIPPAGQRIALTGATDLAAIYELKDNSSTIADILRLQGGTPALAYTQKALIERVDTASTPARQVLEVNLQSGGLAQALRDADLVTLLPISKAFSNAVTLRGNVAQPLRFAFKPGMRISDLIPDVQALVQPQYHMRKNALVQYEDPEDAKDPRDLRDIRSPKDSKELRMISGANRNRPDNTNQPLVEPQPTDVRNLLNEINWSYAAIERLDASEVRTVLIPFNLAKAVKDRDPASNLQLLPGDVVTIFSTKDLPIPTENQTQLVRISGEVMVPGVYQIMPGETLPQLVQRAGGLSRNAFSYGTVFTRESTRLQQQQNLDKSIRQMEADINAAAASALQNAADAEKAALAQSQIAGQRLMLQRLSTLKSSGRVALDLDPDTPVLPALALQGGDEISIPMRPSFVGIFGEVHSDTAFIHKASYTVADYLKKAGLTRDADTGHVKLIRADGTVESDSNTLSLWGSGVMNKRLSPGDSIFVPAKLDRRGTYASLIQGAKDWTAIFYQFGLGAAGLKSLRN